MLAQGVPLMLAGDEVGNTQNGNNNAYCQDDEIGWVDWEGLGREGDDMTDFVGHMTALRQRFPQIRAHRWLDGQRADGSYGVLWLTPAAEDMKEAGLEFSGRPLSRLCARARCEHGDSADLHRAQCRPRSDRVHAAEDAGIQELAASAEHRRRQTDRRGLRIGSETKAPPRSVLAFAGSP